MMEKIRPSLEPDMKPFGNRLEGMTPESQHAITGNLTILPAKKDEKP